MRPLRGGLAGAAVALAALCAPSVATAATLEVPADFASIQAAIDAADPGDTVAVKARNAPYEETVEVATSEIAIVGVGGRPAIDGFDPDETPTVIDIQADDVMIRNLALVNEEAYDCVADGCDVRDVRIRGLLSGDCVEIDGDDARVSGSRFQWCGDNAVDVEGENARVLENRARAIDSACFRVNDAEPLVRGNSATRCEDGEGYDLTDSNGAVIEDNVVRAVDNSGFDVDGEGVTLRGNQASLTDSECFELNDADDALIAGNVASDCDGGLRLVGDDIVARGNEVDDSADFPCIRASGDRAVIADNRMDDCYKGVEAFGENPAVTGNDIADVTTDDGIGVFCSDDFDDPDPPDPLACEDTLVASNVVNGTGDDDSGISVSIESGTGKAVIRTNVVRDAFDDGIEARMDNGLVERNTVSGAGSEEEEGIDVIGTGNVIQRNVSSSNGGDGIRVSPADDTSFGNVIRMNTVRGNGQDGINTDGSADLVRDNVALGNFGEGIEIDGLAVDVIDNTSAGNGRVDCATDGSTDELSGNECEDGSDFLVPSSGFGGS